MLVLLPPPPLSPRFFRPGFLFSFFLFDDTAGTLLVLSRPLSPNSLLTLFVVTHCTHCWFRPPFAVAWVAPLNLPLFRLYQLPIVSSPLLISCRLLHPSRPLLFFLSSSSPSSSYPLRSSLPICLALPWLPFVSPILPALFRPG
ncbi:hypothetical protein LY76DRAFT_112090 [Colletotrichum caudatum]|nr:hypothetical protein LY76DRAFT_112090 [Colletotrichum caudatum]